MTEPWVNAYIALGANLGDRCENLRQARRLLTQNDDIACIAASRIYETSPMGAVTDQPDYLNAVVGIATQLTVDALLNKCLAVEAKLGRVRREVDGPRTIDLDLLLFGDAAIDRPDLRVPHPRMHLRRFVLQPLADIVGDAIHPTLKQTIRELLAKLPTDSDRVEPAACDW